MDDWSGLATKLWNFLSATAIVGTISGVFPYVAGFIGMCYYLVMLYESATVQSYLHTRRLRKIAKHRRLMAALEAQEITAAARKLAKQTKATGI